MRTNTLSLLTVTLAVGLFTSTVPLGAQTCMVPPAGLVGWWSGDGRGDLASLPAARVELLNLSVRGTNASLTTVCHGGVSAWMEFTDDLGAPNWQTVPGTKTLIPYSGGSIATPQTWPTCWPPLDNIFFVLQLSEETTTTKSLVTTDQSS